MPNAYTFTKGSDMREFTSRKELYDYMLEQGEIILEGDDAPIFLKHCEKRVTDKHRVAEKAKIALDKING